MAGWQPFLRVFAFLYKLLYCLHVRVVSSCSQAVISFEYKEKSEADTDGGGDGGDPPRRV